MADGGVIDAGRKYQKSYFDVLGLCCTSEVPLVEKILGSLDGVVTISVIVPSRTVIVVHDSFLISQLQIVKALNQAKLEATVRAYGSGMKIKSWPSPYTMACFVLLALSFLGHVYGPLRWLALVAIGVGIPPIVLRSVASLRRFTVDINVLMLIAVAGSIALKDYWEGGTIVFLFTLSDWLNSRATYEATAVMSSLVNMIPQKAVLAETGNVVDAKDVKINTILSVKAGEVIPIDGIVTEGSCEVDESSLTGESFPVSKQPESAVWAGTHNLNGYISFKTTSLAENSAVAKMTKLVEEAQNSKSRMHRMIDTCAKYYTPVVIFASAAIAAVPAIMRVHNLTYWLHLALVLLVSACPCALVLSTPVAAFCALSKAAMTGLLVKGSDFLETLAKTKAVAFDKTGTLTKGEFSVMDFHSVKDDISMDVLLYWVSSIESKSSHPMSLALIDHARSFAIEPKPDDVHDFQTFPGEGVYGVISGKKVHIGNQRISARAGCEAVGDVSQETKGVTIGYVFSTSELVGWFSLSDTCRTGATEAIKELKGLNTAVVMLTGDSSAAASHVQSQVGGSIDRVHSELLPEDKVRLINQLKSEEGTTVMVGDGINDAPALTAADVGISMGISGSAIAMETSHITMMSNDIRKIPKVIRLARRMKWKIIQNIVLSISTKGAILALAFAGHPILWAAVLVDVGTCLLVILNSMTLLRRTKHKAEKCHGSLHASHRNGLSVPADGKHHDHCHHGHEDHFHKSPNGSVRDEEKHHGWKHHDHRCHKSHNGFVQDAEKHHGHAHCVTKDQHQESQAAASGNRCSTDTGCCRDEVRRSDEVKADGCCASRMPSCNSTRNCCEEMQSHSSLELLIDSHAICISGEVTQNNNKHVSSCKTSPREQPAGPDSSQRKARGCCRSCSDKSREPGEASFFEGNIPKLSEIVTE